MFPRKLHTIHDEGTCRYSTVLALIYHICTVYLHTSHSQGTAWWTSVGNDGRTTTERHPLGRLYELKIVLTRAVFYQRPHKHMRCLPYTDSYICILYIPSYHIHAIRMHPSTYVDGRRGERLNTIARTVHVLGEIITITLKCNNCVWTRSGRLLDDLYKIMRPVMVLRLISYRYKISILRLKISHYICI